MEVKIKKLHLKIRKTHKKKLQDFIENHNNHIEEITKIRKNH